MPWRYRQAQCNLAAAYIGAQGRGEADTVIGAEKEFLGGANVTPIFINGCMKRLDSRFLRQ
jgi:hypothetical protein